MSESIHTTPTDQIGQLHQETLNDERYLLEISQIKDLAMVYSDSIMDSFRYF